MLANVGNPFRRVLLGTLLGPIENPQSHHSHMARSPFQAPSSARAPDAILRDSKLQTSEFPKDKLRTAFPFPSPALSLS
jgi:hypothetical protein